MAVLIRQELYKLFRRKKTLVVIAAFLLLTLLLTYGIKQNADYMKQYSTPEFQIENLEGHNEYLEMEIKSAPNHFQGDELENYQENLKEELERNNQEIERLKLSMNEDISWQESLAKNIEAQEEYIEENKNSQDSMYLSQMKMELEELKYLQENNIETQENYELNAFKYINEIIENLGQVFLVIGIAIFAADMVSGEWTPPTMKLLLVQPVSRGKVLLSKFIATIIAAVALILIIELIFFIAVGLLFGFGNMDYPTVVNKAFDYDYSIFFDDGSHPLGLVDGSWDIVPVWQYTLKLFAYQALFIIATASFVFMISSIAKSSMISMGVSVVSLIAGSIIFQINSFYGISKYVFTTYSSLGAIITGDIAMYLDHPGFTETSGIIILIAWTIICYAISHVFFNKRDMLV